MGSRLVIATVSCCTISFAVSLLASQHRMTDVQTPECKEASVLAAAATARSLTDLAKLRSRVGDTYTSRLVFTVRRFELDSRNKHTAVALLDLIPRDDAEGEAWYALPDMLCRAAPKSQMRTLDRLQDRFPRDFAAAVILAPERMQKYVEYAYTAVQPPGSDYAVQMERVCRIRNREFVESANRLGYGERGLLRGVFDVKKCRALKLPETR